MFPNIFNSCDTLEEVNIPKNVKKISKMTFYHCLNLKSITLPEWLEEIGESAFNTCPSIKSLVQAIMQR